MAAEHKSTASVPASQIPSVNAVASKDGFFAQDSLLTLLNKMLHAIPRGDLSTLGELMRYYQSPTAFKVTDLAFKEREDGNYVITLLDQPGLPPYPAMVISAAIFKHCAGLKALSKTQELPAGRDFELVFKKDIPKTIVEEAIRKLKGIPSAESGLSSGQAAESKPAAPPGRAAF